MPPPDPRVDHLEGRILAVESTLEEIRDLLVKTKRYVDAQTGSIPPPPLGGPPRPVARHREKLDTGEFMIRTEIDQQFSKLHAQLEEERAHRAEREREVARREKEQYDRLVAAQDAERAAKAAEEAATREAQAKAIALESARLRGRQRLAKQVAAGVVAVLLAVVGAYSAGSHASSTPAPPAHQR